VGYLSLHSAVMKASLIQTAARLATVVCISPACSDSRKVSAPVQGRRHGFSGGGRAQAGAHQTYPQNLKLPDLVHYFLKRDNFPFFIPVTKVERSSIPGGISPGFADRGTYPPPLSPRWRRPCSCAVGIPNNGHQQNYTVITRNTQPYGTYPPFCGNVVQS